MKPSLSQDVEGGGPDRPCKQPCHATVLVHAPMFSTAARRPNKDGKNATGMEKAAHWWQG
jgi:hypothetical protein